MRVADCDQEVLVYVEPCSQFVTHCGGVIVVDIHKFHSSRDWLRYLRHIRVNSYSPRSDRLRTKPMQAPHVFVNGTTASGVRVAQALLCVLSMNSRSSTVNWQSDGPSTIASWSKRSVYCKRGSVSTNSRNFLHTCDGS